MAQLISLPFNWMGKWTGESLFFFFSPPYFFFFFSSSILLFLVLTIHERQPGLSRNWRQQSSQSALNVHWVAVKTRIPISLSSTYADTHTHRLMHAHKSHSERRHVLYGLREPIIKIQFMCKMPLRQVTHILSNFLKYVRGYSGNSWVIWFSGTNSM